MTNYRKGRSLEYEVTNIFKKAGWSVIRGAGSKGEVDGMKVDIQVSKRGTKYLDTVYIALLQAKRVSHGSLRRNGGVSKGGIRSSGPSDGKDGVQGEPTNGFPD